MLVHRQRCCISQTWLSEKRHILGGEGLGTAFNRRRHCSSIVHAELTLLAFHNFYRWALVVDNLLLHWCCWVVHARYFLPAFSASELELIETHTDWLLGIRCNKMRVLLKLYVSGVMGRIVVINQHLFIIKDSVGLLSLWNSCLGHVRKRQVLCLLHVNHAMCLNEGWATAFSLNGIPALFKLPKTVSLPLLRIKK